MKTNRKKSVCGLHQWCLRSCLHSDFLTEVQSKWCRYLNNVIYHVLLVAQKCQGHGRYSWPITHTNTHACTDTGRKHTHWECLHGCACAKYGARGIDKSQLPASPKSTHLIEVNFKKGGAPNYCELYLCVFWCQIMGPKFCPWLPFLWSRACGHRIMKAGQRARTSPKIKPIFIFKMLLQAMWELIFHFSF